MSTSLTVLHCCMAVSAVEECEGFFHFLSIALQLCYHIGVTHLFVINQPFSLVNDSHQRSTQTNSNDSFIKSFEGVDKLCSKIGNLCRAMLIFTEECQMLTTGFKVSFQGPQETGALEFSGLPFAWSALMECVFFTSSELDAVIFPAQMLMLAHS